MFHAWKFAVMVEVLLLLQILTVQNIFLVEASVRSGKAKSFEHNNQVVREQSSKEISVEEDEKIKSEKEQFYYLPMQTVFGETDTSTRADGLSTSPPPHISIDPAPIQTNYQESTGILHKDLPADSVYYSVSYQSQCVSETPAMELESRFLLPSRDVAKESVIMSGHLEIASKTSAGEEVSEIGNIVSKPSIALQGTILNSHSIRDL